MAARLRERYEKEVRSDLMKELGFTNPMQAPKLEKIKGMNITVVTTARNDEEGRALLRHLGMPFRQ